MDHRKQRQGRRAKHPSLRMDVPQWALDRVPGDATARHVLHVLCAHRSNGDGLAYPSVSTICRLTGYGERTTQRALRRLCEAGAIRLHRFATPNCSTVYAIPDAPFPAVAGCQNDGGEGCHSNGPQTPERGVKMAPELSISTELPISAAVAVPAHAMRARAVSGATIHNSRRDPNQRPDLRVVA
jgi:hypothetical protein